MAPNQNKAYYDAHESAYQQIKAKGFVGWGNAPSLAELGDEFTNLYLSQIVSSFFPTTNLKTALDVGCGTGTTAFLFSKLGFQVTGIDVSETALEMGRELAEQQNFEIHFQRRDLLKMENSVEKFDLIYDSHCFHCIVFEEDRALALSNLKGSLNPEGIFILDTMVMPSSLIDLTQKIETLRFDENYILWHKTKPSQDYGVVELEGQHWCAQRRVYPAEIVIDEVKTAGFEILAQQIDLQSGEPSMLRMVLR